MGNLSFDPLEQWLQIAPENQPPTYYQLLGINSQETSLDTINQAAERQLTIVRQHLGSEHDAVAQKLIQRIEKARQLLLNPTSKQQYDAKLKAKSNPQQRPQKLKRAKPLNQLTPAVTQPTVAPIVESKTSARARSTATTKKSPVVLWTAMGGGFVALLVIIIMVVVNMGSPSPPDTDNSNDNQPGNSIAGRTGRQQEGSSRRNPAAKGTAASTELSLPELIKLIEPSVVKLSVSGPLGRGIGSGFFVDDQGTIVTNYHVVRYASQAEAMFDDRTKASIQGYLLVEPKKDLAVLQLATINRKTKPLSIAHTFPEKGEDVLAMGAPRGFSFTPSEGIVSAVRSGRELREIFMDTMGFDIFRLTGFEMESHWVQTTAPISPGNSGGPLVNMQGQLVGVNTWHRPDGQNLNFAVSSQDVQAIIGRSRKEQLKPLSDLAHQRTQLIVQVQLPEQRPTPVKRPKVKLPAQLTAAALAKFSGHTEIVNSVAVSRDGRYIATASDDKFVHVLDAEKLTSLQRFGPHETDVTGAAFVQVSADTTVAVSTRKSTERSKPSIVFWSLEQQQRVHELPDSHIDADSLVIAPNQERLAVVMSSAAARMYSISPFGRVGLEASKTAPCRAVAFSPDSRYVLSSSGSMVVIWIFDEQRKGPVRDIARTANSNVNCIVFSHQGDRVYTGHDDGLVRCWDFATGNLLAKYSGHSGPVTSIAISHDLPLLISGSIDKTVRAWDIEKQTTLTVLNGHSAAIRSVCLLPGTKRVVTAGDDKTVRLWELADPGQVAANTPKSDPNGSSSQPTDPSSTASPFKEVKRIPRPTDSNVATARELVREVFQDEMEQAKTKRLKTQLALKLLKHAAGATSEHERYAPFSEAGLLSLSAPDPDSAIQAAELIGERYEVDAIQIKYQTIVRLSQSVRLREDRMAVIDGAISCADQAAVNQQFEVAKQLAAIAKKVAQSVLDSNVLARANNRVIQAENDYDKWTIYQQALATLNVDPNNQEAQRQVGTYACTRLNDWPVGLQHLAKSNSVEIRAAAAMDLDEPNDPLTQAKLGDAWLELSSELNGREKLAFLSRSRLWYQTALPKLQSLQKLKVEKNLARIEAALR